jgi:exoribonuclease R
MGRAEALGGQIERAVIDLAEAVMLESRIGEIFPAIVTDADERGARLQLRHLPVVARVPAGHVRPGDTIRVRLKAADPAQRALTFERVG